MTDSTTPDDTFILVIVAAVGVIGYKFYSQIDFEQILQGVKHAIFWYAFPVIAVIFTVFIVWFCIRAWLRMKRVAREGKARNERQFLEQLKKLQGAHYASYDDVDEGFAKLKQLRKALGASHARDCSVAYKALEQHYKSIGIKLQKAQLQREKTDRDNLKARVLLDYFQQNRSCKSIPEWATGYSERSIKLAVQAFRYRVAKKRERKELCAKRHDR